LLKLKQLFNKQGLSHCFDSPITFSTMKLISYFLLFLTLHLSAQPKLGFIKGKIETSKPIAAIHLSNTEGLDISIPLNKSKQFTYNCTNLKKGFCYLDEIGTVYLAPSYQLQIISNKEGDYTFSGKGALENNNFRAAKKALEQFFPNNGGESMGDLNQATYYLEVPIFEQKLDSFQQHGIALINKSLDSFYRKYTLLDFKYYCRSLISEYTSFYGTDLQLLGTVGDSIRKLDSKAPDYVKKITALMASTHKKQLNGSDRMRLYELSSGKFDMNDAMLFRNSRNYRKAFENYFQSVSFSKYITADEYKGKVTDRNIKRLIVARGEIKNPFILNYFEYTYTKGIVNDHKDIDTVNKYYNEYIAKAKNEAYISEIKKIYDNKIAYSDNHAAPSFKYKDVTGRCLGNLVWPL